MAKRGPKKGTGGRPRIDVDFDKIDQLCGMHCTPQEIVANLNIFTEKTISYDTVERRVKDKSGLTFAEYVNQKHMARAKPMLRKLQWVCAQSGNPTMLIWLGKQYLGQRDSKDNAYNGQTHEEALKELGEP